jgi:hypothetical protein
MASLLFQYPHPWCALLDAWDRNPELAEHLIQENDRALEDYLGGLVAGSGSSLLAETIYNPGARVNYFPTGEVAGVCLDTTNLKVTFTPPASGTVYIYLEAGANGLLGDSRESWVILDNPGSVGAGAAILGERYQVAAATGINRYTSRHKITGLTPGTPITVYWGHAMNYVDFSPFPFTAAGGNVGPAIMTVRSE